MRDSNDTAGMRSKTAAEKGNKTKKKQDRSKVLSPGYPPWR